MVLSPSFCLADKASNVALTVGYHRAYTVFAHVASTMAPRETPAEKPKRRIVVAFAAHPFQAGDDQRIVGIGTATVCGMCDLAHFALARFTTSGRLDAAFRKGGIVETELGMDSTALDGAIQADGKIVAAGYWGRRRGRDGPDPARRQDPRRRVGPVPAPTPRTPTPWSPGTPR